jgi:hypothetical protein
LQREIKFFAHDTGEEGADRMLLPTRRLHDGGDGCAFWSAKKAQHPVLLGPDPPFILFVKLILFLNGRFLRQHFVASRSNRL